MLKAILDTKDNRRMLLLVLERGNIEHFEKGSLLHLHAEEMEMPRFNINEILIVFFETKEDALKYFAEHEMITSDTLFHHEKPPQ